MDPPLPHLDSPSSTYPTNSRTRSSSSSSNRSSRTKNSRSSIDWDSALTLVSANSSPSIKSSRANQNTLATRSRLARAQAALSGGEMREMSFEEGERGVCLVDCGTGEECCSNTSGDHYSTMRSSLRQKERSSKSSPSSTSRSSPTQPSCLPSPPTTRSTFPPLPTFIPSSLFLMSGLDIRTGCHRTLQVWRRENEAPRPLARAGSR
ncbi:hypothetical protein BDY24DRAFT_13572 [Mrakia frigida]|uniref:uncharacterized protein n=1 Tax=Mrakia frigida TaxID=29902 RepID=UPI003FCC1E97